MKNKDIAKQLNISPATVSLVLNNKPGVSDRVRNMVFDFIKKTEQNNPRYFSKLKGNILLIVHKVHGKILNSDSFYSDIIESIQQVAYSEKYDLKVSYYNPEMDVNMFINDLSKHDASGILLIATEMLEQDIAPYLSIKKPIILIDNHFDLLPFDSITINNTQGMFESIKYLYGLGHRKIGFIRNNIAIKNISERYDAYLKAMRYFNLPVNEEFIYSVDSILEGINEDMFQQLHEREHMPTAFIVANTIMTFSIGRALKKFGYKIPAEMSFISFDDPPYSLMSHPPATTVGANASDMGYHAVKRLIQRIESAPDGKGLDTIHTEVNAKLIVRESVAPVHGDQKTV